MHSCYDATGTNLNCHPFSSHGCFILTPILLLLSPGPTVDVNNCFLCTQCATRANALSRPSHYLWRSICQCAKSALRSATSPSTGNSALPQRATTLMLLQCAGCLHVVLHISQVLSGWQNTSVLVDTLCQSSTRGRLIPRIPLHSSLHSLRTLCAGYGLCLRARTRTVCTLGACPP